MEAILNKMLAAGSAMIGCGVLLTRFFYTVDGGERGIIFDKFRGVRPKVYGEGMHFYVPGLQEAKIFEIRLRPQIIHSTTGTRDMQSVMISLRLLHRPDPEYLPTIYLNLGENYDERVLPSIGNEVLKAVVAQYNADQLLTQREKVSLEIKEILVSRAADFHILLDDVAITHLQYGAEFSHAIELKQVAQQHAEKSKFIVMKNEEMKKAAVIRAEGEAESARLISEAIRNAGPGLIAVRKIETALDMTENLTQTPNVTFLSDNAVNLMNIPAFGVAPRI